MSLPTLFKNKQPPAINSALWQKFNEELRNIPEKMTVPSLTPGGKMWTVSMNGAQTVLQKRDDDGDMVNLTTIRTVVIGANPNRSRAMYLKTYDKDNPAPPDCWSNDGNKPDPSIEKPPCATCKSCPMTVKGSKIDDRGKATTACQQQKFLAVLPVSTQIWEQPLRLKLSITSIYDGQSPDLQKEGWYAWDQYVDMLRANGVHSTALVITKMKFDQTEYPKIIFAADDYCTNEQLEFLLKLQQEKKEEIENLTSRTWTPAGVDGVRTDDALPAPAAPTEDEVAEDAIADDTARIAAEAEAKKAEAKKAKAAAKKAAAEAAAKAAAEAAAAAARAAEEEDDDEDEDDAPAPFEMPGVINGKVVAKEDKPAPAKKTTPPAASAAVPDDLAKLVGDWAKTK
jgi:hypothetical protein